MKLLSDLFQVDPTAAVKYQMELTDIQNDRNEENTHTDKTLTQAGRQGSETLTTAHKNRKNTITHNKNTQNCRN